MALPIPVVIHYVGYGQSSISGSTFGAASKLKANRDFSIT